MDTSLRETFLQHLLFNLQDTEYRDFHAHLMPNIPKERIIGVRTPALRALAATLCKDSNTKTVRDDFLSCAYPVPEYMTTPPKPAHTYYEENNLHAAFICLMGKKDIDFTLVQTERFLPFIDNWATCDMFSPKIFQKYPSQLYEKVIHWIQSPRPYTVRFALDMLMQFFSDDLFTTEMPQLAASIRSNEYYVNMAIAWYFSVLLAKQYDSVVKLLETPVLPPAVHNKAIQKALESFRVTPDHKTYLRSLKLITNSESHSSA